ncbi:transcriptional regulator, partial [Vibrio splendidus]
MKQQIYQICDARYDPLLRLFVREDGHVETIAPLEGKVFLFLLENAGECIERGLIFDRCWGNVIVSEQALTNVISKIRKTLSRVTCGCATIRTVSKTGYSLEIDELNRSTVTEEVPSQATEKVSKTNSSPVEQEVLAATEISTDVNTATAPDSDLKTFSNQELNS